MHSSIGLIATLLVIPSSGALAIMVAIDADRDGCEVQSSDVRLEKYGAPATRGSAFGSRDISGNPREVGSARHAPSPIPGEAVKKACYANISICFVSCVVRVQPGVDRGLRS